jgi:hypothetical protein
MKAAKVTGHEQPAQARQTPTISLKLLLDICVGARRAKTGVEAEAGAGSANVKKTRGPFRVGDLPLRCAVRLLMCHDFLGFVYTKCFNLQLKN